MVKFIVLWATNNIINICESSVELLIKHKQKQLVYVRVLLKRNKENLFDLLFGNISLTVKLEILKDQILEKCGNQDPAISLLALWLHV